MQVPEVAALDCVLGEAANRRGIYAIGILTRAMVVGSPPDMQGRNGQVAILPFFLVSSKRGFTKDLMHIVGLSDLTRSPSFSLLVDSIRHTQLSCHQYWVNSSHVAPKIIFVSEAVVSVRSPDWSPMRDATGKFVHDLSIPWV